MTRNFGCFAAVSFAGLIGCGQQEPAVAPLAPPPAVTVAAPPPVIEAKKEEPKPALLTAEHKLKVYQGGWAASNAKDFAKLQAQWAEDARSETLDMGPPAVGPSAITEHGARAFATAFPDGTAETQLTLLNNNQVFGVVLLRGTQTGPLQSPTGTVPPTGKKIGLLAAHLLELNDAGKAVKESMAYDGGTLAGQLGLLPAPHRKALEAGWADKPVVVATGGETEKANLAAFNAGVVGFNKHDAAAALGAAADDIVFAEMTAPADRVGKKEAVKGIEEMFKAFPDVKLEVASAWPAGDYVVATGTWSGTNTGDVPGMKLKKTGKSVSVHFIEVDRFVGGKTKNIWLFSNGAAAAAQLGLLPPKTPELKGKEPAAHKPAAEPKPVVAAKPAAEPKPVVAAKPAAEPKPTPSKPAVTAPAAKPTPAK